MPCYRPRWDYQLQPGTAAYDSARSNLHARMRATHHIVDYYLKLRGLPLPMPDAADAEMMTAWGQSVGETSRLPPDDLGTATIVRYGLAVYLIAHHLRCDGVTYEDLWDQQTLLSISDPSDLGYGWIIRWCVGVMTRRFERSGWSIQLTRKDQS